MSVFDDFELLLIKLALEMQVKKAEQELKDTLESQGITIETHFEINVKSVDLDTWHKAVKGQQNATQENADDDTENTDTYTMQNIYKE